MSRKYYPSEHKDDTLGLWLEVYIHQLDSHVLWSAKLNTRVENSDEIISKWFFKDYFCDSEILHEFIKRGIVANVTKDVKKHITEHAWIELNEVINCCKPYISIPLNEETENHYDKYRTPNERIWFEVVVEQFSEVLVQFSMSLFGYKYILKSLELKKQEFYEFADRLDGKVRFNNDWFPLDAIRNKLLFVSDKGALSCISRDLAHELELLKKPTSRQVVSSCRAIFPLIERTLRDHADKKGWKGRTGNMDLLVNMHENNNSLSKDIIELLRFVTKPLRDYTGHGRDIDATVAKVVLATALELLIRLNDELQS